jgi:hypothetical protein
MLKAYNNETIFLFIPKEEKEQTKIFEDANPGQKYAPFMVQHIQLSGELASNYKAKTNTFFKQTQETTVVGKESKTLTHTDIDVKQALEIDKQFAKAIIKKATNFAIPLEGKEVAFPVKDEKGVVTQEWCDDKHVIDKVVDLMVDFDFLQEFIIHARNLSELTPFEKKS